MRRRGLAGAIVAAALSLGVPTAVGDAQLAAVQHDRFGPTVTIAQGESLTFYNGDSDRHNVTAASMGADGNPLFASATIGTGESAVVAGTRYLTTGTYGFNCTLHPFMQGTLVVSSAGAPLARPATQPAPGPAAKKRGKCRRHQRCHRRKRKRRRRR